MTRHCILTGASGYLGGVIANKLRAEGWDVVPASRMPKAGGVKFKLGEAVSPDLFAGADALIHCAYDFAPTRWRDIEAINVRGAALLFDAATRAGVKHTLLISTISAFDGCRSLYGRAKLEIERHAMGRGAAVVRPALIYGEAPGGMFGRLVAQVRAASLVPMPGDGKQMMYTVREADLAEVIARALIAPPSAAPITAAHETPTAFIDLLRAIGAKLGRPVTPIPFPWQAMWLGLRMAELLRAPIGLRSDSLVSLVNQNRAPVLNAASLGVACRPFSLDDLNL